MSGEANGGAAAVVDLPFSSTEVFALLADIEQLPRWAQGLFYELKVGRDGWCAYTPWGELTLELTADAVTGFVYLEVSAGREVRGVFSFWVVDGGVGRTRVRLMSFMEREVPAGNEVLDGLYAALLAELPGLGQVLEAGWPGSGIGAGLAQNAA